LFWCHRDASWHFDSFFDVTIRAYLVQQTRQGQG
jgi:hypothetical protein